MHSSCCVTLRRRIPARIPPIRLFTAVMIGVIATAVQAEAQTTAQSTVSIEVPPIVRVEAIHVESLISDSAGAHLQAVEVLVSANVDWVLHARSTGSLPIGFEWVSEMDGSPGAGGFHRAHPGHAGQWPVAAGTIGADQRVRIIYRWGAAHGHSHPPNIRYFAEATARRRSEVQSQVPG